jgi:hypothetical protein
VFFETLETVVVVIGMIGFIFKGENIYKSQNNSDNIRNREKDNKNQKENFIFVFQVFETGSFFNFAKLLVVLVCIEFQRDELRQEKKKRKQQVSN